KILSEQFLTVCIHFRESVEELAPLFWRIPVSQDEIDEFIHARCLCSWGIGLRNDHFSHSNHGCILMSVERPQAYTCRYLQLQCPPESPEVCWDSRHRGCGAQ